MSLYRNKVNTTTRRIYLGAIKDTISRYKENIFGVDSPICKKCLDQLEKQKVIDEKVYDKMRIDDTVRKLYGFQENVVTDGNIMTDKKTGEFLSPEVDCNCWKEKFLQAIKSNAARW